MAAQSECIACLKSLPLDGIVAACSECQHAYHTGKCSGVTRKALMALSPERRTAWKCNTCTLHAARQSTVVDDQQTPDGGSPTQPASLSTRERSLDKIVAQNDDISKRLMDVLSRIEFIEKALETQTGKGDTIMAKLDHHGKTVDAIDTAMTNLSAKYDELLRRLDTQSVTITELTKRTGELEARVAEQDVQIRDLKTAVDNAEQYSRRKNVEIHGIVQQPNENVLDVLKDLAAKLDLPQPGTEDIEAAHRLRSREGKIPPVLIRFAERKTRDLWMTKRVTLRNENIYINENLTKTLKGLLWQTRECARAKAYKFVWMRNGKIFVRQKEGAGAIRIESERDLTKLT